MIGCVLKTLLRFLLEMMGFRSAGKAFLLRILGRFYYFQCNVERDYDEIIEIKKDLRASGKSVGHAVQSKAVKLTLFGYNLWNLEVEKGVELTAEHFFLSRPVNDVKLLLDLCKDYICIMKDDLIFDPGCGTGRHLFYLCDRFQCRGIGVDIYEPAIKVANKANYDNHISFHNRSMVESSAVSQLMPDNCDFVFINSWLNHVFHYPRYNAMVRELLERCRYMLIINSVKFHLETLLPDCDFLIFKVQDNTQYALIKGKLC